MTKIKIDIHQIHQKIIHGQCHYCGKKAAWITGMSGDVLGMIPPIPVCEFHRKKQQTDNPNINIAFRIGASKKKKGVVK